MKPLIITGPAPLQAAGGLTETEREVVRTYAENNMSINATASKLFRHWNGVSYILGRVQEKTGLDPRKFFDLYQLVMIAAGTNIIEVTRCADCEHSKNAYTNTTGVKICPATGLFFHEDDYCSYAIRRCDNAQGID